MAEMLLINPRRRKSSKRASPAQLRARAAFAAKFGGGKRRRRRNPASVARSGSARRANPAPRYGRRIMRRRRNPISLGGLGLNTIFAAFKDAAVMGGGAIAMDVGYKYVEDMLPMNLKRTPGAPDLGDAIKALFTVVVGRALRGPTRGLSMKAATGALTVQAYNLIKQQLPASLQVNGLEGLGYGSPALVYQGSSRIGPHGLQGYTAPGVTPLLNEYVGDYDSPLLSGAEAEGYMR